MESMDQIDETLIQIDNEKLIQIDTPETIQPLTILEIEKINLNWKAQLPENYIFSLSQPSKSTLQSSSSSNSHSMVVSTWSYPTSQSPTSKTLLTATFNLTERTFNIEFDKKTYKIDDAYDFECCDLISIINAKEKVMRDLQKVIGIKSKDSCERDSEIFSNGEEEGMVDYEIRVAECDIESFFVECDREFARKNADEMMKEAVKVTKKEVFALVDAL